MDRNIVFGAVTIAAASLAFATAQPGDPARWYVPAETPAEKYAVAHKEAGAALKEALQECKATHTSEDRKACMAAARAQWKEDLRRAQDRRDADRDAVAMVKP